MLPETPPSSSDALPDVGVGAAETPAKRPSDALPSFADMPSAGAEEPAAPPVSARPAARTPAPAVTSSDSAAATPAPEETGVAEATPASSDGAAGAAGAAAPAAAPRARRTRPADAATSAEAPARNRIEVPTPSVVRARERGRVAEQNPVVLRTEMLTKVFGSTVAANEVSFEVHGGSLTGVVGPNGAGKTTTLSMISGLLRPSSGRVAVGDVDVWADGAAAKRLIGTLPDRLRLFDRLTGGQLLYYSGVLHGVAEAEVAKRSAELAEAFGLESALDRLVSDYSAGMQKKIALACSMIHAPEVLVLDEPFEAIDPVSAANVTDILEKYVAGGGSVVMSSHSLELIQRVCDHVVIIVDGSVIAQGTVDEVRDGVSLEDRFRALTGIDESQKGLQWLHGSSDSE
ncbi:ABC-2 type transport system ATP-binding protein [Mycolicibacterium mucogenicum 261Sha1.1M5]|nr:ABC-2 type transport system ATP-binding protein [Mycolicibacterium mucogenicum 261Sha1.1M5]